MYSFRYFMLLTLLVGGVSCIAQAATCGGEAKIAGFSTIKTAPGGKAFFFQEPRDCGSSQTCAWQRKAYLLTGNFVQTAQMQGSFVCAIFRNYNGWGGRKTIGWLPLSALAPIRAKLERKDLQGSWYQAPCNEDDDCGIDISEDNGKRLSVSILSHIHSHPGAIFTISDIKEQPGKLVITGMAAGEEKPQKIEIIYDSKELEPGTILLRGDETFGGVYHR